MRHNRAQHAAASQVLCLSLLHVSTAHLATSAWVSAIGDPLLQSPSPAVLVTGWNFCNEALAPPSYPDHPSPRWADCADAADAAVELVTAADNALGPGDPFPLPGYNASKDANAYAVAKGLFLGQLCSRPPAASAAGSAAGQNWSYHTMMWKSGNMDEAAGICPQTETSPSAPAGTVHARAGSGFNNLSMNQPLTQLTPATPQQVPYSNTSLGFVGWASGTYDVDPSWAAPQREAVRAALNAYTRAWVAFRFAELDSARPLLPRPTPPALLVNKSYIATIWWKNVSSGSTVFTHMQETSKAAPWCVNGRDLASERVRGASRWHARIRVVGRGATLPPPPHTPISTL